VVQGYFSVGQGTSPRHTSTCCHQHAFLQAMGRHGNARGNRSERHFSADFPAEDVAAAAESLGIAGEVAPKRGDRSGVSDGKHPSSPHDVATPSRAGSRAGGAPGNDAGAGQDGRADRERPRGQASALEEIMRRKGVDEAWAALEEMQKQGVVTDKYTVSRMLMKTVGDGRTRLNPTRVYRGIALVEKFVEMQPKDVDEVLLNALLDTCCRLKDLGRLEATVQRMRDLKITPSPVTLGILVKTYGQAGDIQKVLQVWSEMEKQRGQANAVTYGCMIDACVKCGRLEKAVEIFGGMKQAGKHRNTIIYTTLIKGYGLEKDLNSALELFREMPAEGVPYNTITYNSIIDACVKGGDLATAESLLREITSPGSQLEPDLITFSTLLKGYCHVGDLDKALQVVETIKARGLRCDELIYNTLMDGCVKANDMTAGVGLFEEMVQNGMRPSAITHSILARLYQRAGYEDDAPEAVAQLYQHHNIERPTGGDRAKGPGGRRPFKSPGGRGGSSHAASGDATPIGSPSVGFGFQHERNHACWNAWDDSQSLMSGHDGFSEQSAPSTPHGSPMHSAPGGGLFLPLEAVRGMPPPLPGMGGSETPYGSPMPTPLNSGFQGGSMGGSPYLSPMAGMEHQQHQQHQHQQGQASAGALMSVPASPGMQPFHQPGTPVAQHSQGVPSQGVPNLPPWPFAAPGSMPGAVTPQGNCGAGGATPQGSAGGMDMPYFCQMGQMGPMVQSMPQQHHQQQPLGNMMGGMHMDGAMQQAQASPPNMVQGYVGQAQASAGSMWQAQPADAQQQSPFPMPPSPPHDLASGSAPICHQPNAHFENWAPEGPQPGNMQMQGVHHSAPNPFCL